MNADHADATRLYATALCGASDGHWRFQGVDPLGFEIGRAGEARWLGFPQRATTPADARRVLVRLVGDARAKVAGGG